MPNLMETAARWLTGMQERHNSLPAVYRRGDEAVQVRATPGSTEMQSAGDNVAVRAQADDWIIPADRLVFAGQKATPAEGDRLEILRGTVTEIYEVMPLGNEVYRPVDPYQTAWRIHMKLISRE